MGGKTFLLVGATGFFGPHLAREILAAGHRVICLVRPGRLADSRFDRARLPADAGIAEADPWAPLPHGMAFNALVNLAAYGVQPSDRDVDFAQRVNVDLPLRLLDAASAAGAVMVHAGSSAEYGAPVAGRLIAEDDSLETERLYGRTKAAGSLALMDAAGKAGLPCLVLRLFNLYGSGESPHRLIPSIVAALQSGKRAALSPGRQKRDFIHAGDAARAVLAAADTLAAGQIGAAQVVNVCTGKASSVADLAGLVASALDADPALLGFGDIPMRPDELPWVVGDPARARGLLGWTATTNLEDGVAEAVLGERRDGNTAGNPAARRKESA